MVPIFGKQSNTSSFGTKKEIFESLAKAVVETMRFNRTML
jgi:hypothetical protein